MEKATLGFRIYTGVPNLDFYWGCTYSIEFQKLVTHNPFYRVNFRIIGGARAPPAPPGWAPLAITNILTTFCRKILEFTSGKKSLFLKNEAFLFSDECR